MKKLLIMISVFVAMLMCSFQVSAISGEGTEFNPFLIETEEDFMVIGDFPTMHYKLNSNITVNSVLGDFSGTLDGNGFTLNTSKDYVFSSNSGLINNITVSGGMLATTNNDMGVIDNCYISGGSLIEINNGIIQNSSVTNYYLLVTNNGVVSNCKSAGTASDILAGLVITNNNTIKRCDSTLSISINEIDYNDTYLGGIVCKNNGNITQCSYNGSLSVLDSYSTSSYSSISRTAFLGGISASNTGLIDQSFSAGKISSDVKIETAYGHRGKFSIYAAGISTDGNGQVKDCYSKMNISPYCYVKYTGSSFAYGIEICAYGIGEDSKIQNCYFIGSLGAKYRTSKSLTSSWDTIGNNYGITDSSSNIINSYYLSASPSTDDTTCGTPRSSEAMKMKLCYTDWDFDTIWAIDPEINNGYPYLQWQYEKTEEPVVLEYTINSVKVKNANDEELDSIPETGKCYAEINVTKNTDRNEKDYLIIASYDENDALIDFTYMRGLYNQNQEITFGTLLNVQGVKTIKAFVWDGISSMTPLSNSCIFE